MPDDTRTGGGSAGRLHAPEATTADVVINNATLLIATTSYLNKVFTRPSEVGATAGSAQRKYWRRSFPESTT